MIVHTVAGPTALREAPKRKKFQFNDAYLFIAPSMLVMALFVIYPILQALWMSLHDWSFLHPAHPFVGLGNYAESLSDPRFWKSSESH